MARDPNHGKKLSQKEWFMPAILTDSAIEKAKIKDMGSVQDFSHFPWMQHCVFSKILHLKFFPEPHRSSIIVG